MLQLKTGQANAELADSLGQLQDYTAYLKDVRASSSYEAAESSLNLSADNELLERVKRMAADKVTPTLKYSIVVGIGGSNLGTKAVYDALLGYRDLLEPERFPKMLFAETTDPEWLAAVVRLIGTISSADEVLISLISKSGGTTETLANFEIIMEALRGRFGAGAASRVVAITDEGSKLWDVADTNDIALLPLPKQVGGRYSVLSAVGLLPLASVGIDIEQLRQGAVGVLDQCLGEGRNIAAESAVVLAVQLKQGYTINDNFFFHPELESVGKWYRQLMGESVGKEKSLAGETVHAGITPTVSLGSTL